MAKTAKLFRNGRSQAVRLPEEFRFEGSEVAIRRDEATGDAVLSPARPPTPEEKRKSWEEFLALLDSLDIPADFMSERDDRPAEDRKLFD